MNPVKITVFTHKKKKVKSSTTVFNIHNEKCFLNTKSAY